MISEKILEGLPLSDIFVFDAHGHVGKSATLPVSKHTAEDVVETITRLGVRAICASHFEAILSDTEKGNKMLAEDVKKSGGKLFGYYTPSPFYEDEELQRYFEEGTGFLGVKLHASFQQTSLLNEGYAPALSLANEKKLPVLVHVWSAAEVSGVGELASRYKDSPFIIAHAGLIDSLRDGAIAVCKAHDNVFFDTAISFAPEGSLEYLISKVGADRVVYGSDTPTFDGTMSFARLGMANIPEADKIKIFGENAKKLFKI